MLTRARGRCAPGRAIRPNFCKGIRRLRQSCVFRPRFLDNRNVRVGVLPERQEIVVGTLRLRGLAHENKDSRQLQTRGLRVNEEGPRCGIIVIPLSRGPLAMANLLVRNLDDAVLQELKAAAKAHGRSLQAEIHEVLRNASARRLAETRRLSARWLKRLRGSTQSDSAALIREDRDTR